MRYLIYLRVSTKEQDIRTQLDYCIKHLRSKHGSDDFETLVFSDKVTSRKGVFDRPGSKDMLRTMRKGDTIVAVRVDRLSRIQSHSTKLMDDLKEKQVDVIMIDQPGFSNKLLLGVYTGLAEEELVTLKKRIGEKFESKRSRGEVIGQLPYGYSLDQNILIPIKVGTEWINKPAILIPNLQEQETIQVMIDLQDQGLSYRNIAKKLVEAGRLNRGGKPFGFANIHRILSRISKPKGHSQSHPEQELVPALVSR